MHDRRHLRLSPSLVISLLALAVALGGTSYAAVSLPAGSVGTAQLKNGAVVATKVKPHSLTASNFALGQIPKGQRGPVGLAGPAGPAGTAGAKGDKGDNATKLWAVVRGADGKVLRQSGGISAKTGGRGDGKYTVTFPQDVSNCAPVVTLSSDGNNKPDQGFAGGTIDGNQVKIQTFDSGGGTSNETFSVAVFC
jgi:hypothetical protein